MYHYPSSKCLDKHSKDGIGFALQKLELVTDVHGMVFDSL